MGIEFDKMMEGNQPHSALRDLHRFKVLQYLISFSDEIFFFADDTLTQELISSGLETTLTIERICE